MSQLHCRRSLARNRTRKLYISDLLTPVAEFLGRSTLRASSRGNFVVRRTCRRIGDRAFSVSAARALNKLPTELKLLR